MCRPANCPTCKKASWYGCGEHVPGVMDSISEAERCSCGPKIERRGKDYPPMAGKGVVIKGNAGEESKEGEVKIW